MILPKYEAAFASLSAAEIDCVVRDLSKTHPDLLELGDFESGLEIVDYCRSQHISQAEVIMALSRDTRVEAVTAVEKIVMRPIDRRSPAEVERERDAARPRPQVAAPVPAHSASTDDRIIRVLVEKNPKRAGTSAHDRFAKYRDGMTVAEALRSGLTRGDLQWDQQRAFIRLDDPAQTEAA